MAKKVTIGKDALDFIFAAAKSTIGNSYDRPILQYIQIEVTENKLTSTTLDGYRLSKVTLPHESTGVEPFKCLIQPFAIPKQLRLVEIELGATENAAGITLHCGDFTMRYVFKQPKDDYPNTENILPKTDDALEVYVNARILAEILKPFCKTGDRHHIVRISFTEQDGGINRVAPILLTSAQDEVKQEAMLLPIRHTGGTSNGAN